MVALFLVSWLFEVCLIIRKVIGVPQNTIFKELL